MNISLTEKLLAAQLDGLVVNNQKIPYQTQVEFAKPRRFKADFIVNNSLVVEVQGGTFSNGRHTRGQGYQNDCTKMAIALQLGLKVLFLTTKSVQNGSGISYIKNILTAKQPHPTIPL